MSSVLCHDSVSTTATTISHSKISTLCWRYTNNNGLAHCSPLSGLQLTNSPDAVLTALREQSSRLNQSKSSDDRLTTAYVLYVLSAIGRTMEIVVKVLLHQFSRSRRELRRASGRMSKLTSERGIIPLFSDIYQKAYVKTDVKNFEDGEQQLTRLAR